MFEPLFSSWRTFRALAGGDDEALAYQAYSDFEDACEDVANAGLLDEATRQAQADMPVADAGDLYSDLLNFAAECSLDAQANGEPALVNARVFGIHAVGVLDDIARLHGNQAVVKAVRGSGFVDQDGIVLIAGAMKTGDAARLTPQTVWDFTQQSARVLSAVNNPDFDFAQAAMLRNLLPMLDPPPEAVADMGEVEIGAAVLVGVRIEVSQDVDGEVQPDPLDVPTEAMAEAWFNHLDSALAGQDRCTVLSPMPWRDAVAQSIALAAESHILMQQQFSVPTVSRIELAGTDDGVEMTGFGDDGQVLGSYRLPGDISFWAMPEVVMQLQEQGIELHEANRAEMDLASMPSPGKLLN